MFRRLSYIVEQQNSMKIQHSIGGGGGWHNVEEPNSILAVYVCMHPGPNCIL